MLSSKSLVIEHIAKRTSWLCAAALVACSGGSYEIFPQGETSGVTSAGTGGAAGAGGSVSTATSTGASGGATTGSGPEPATTVATTGTGVTSTTAGGSTGGGSGVGTNTDSTSAAAGGTSGSGPGATTGAGGAGLDAGTPLAEAGTRETGAPDAPPFVSACAGKSRKVTMADPFIGDFENGTLLNWYDFGANGAINRILNESPGAIGTGRAVHLSATGLTSFGAGVGIFTGCLDVSGLDGVSFWAKGLAGVDNIIQFQVALPSTHAVTYGGDCTQRCNDHPSKRFSLTPNWKQYNFTFAELVQGGFGDVARYEGVIMAMNWVSFAGPTVNFWVDEVAFYRGVPSPAPVGRGRSTQ